MNASSEEYEKAITQFKAHLKKHSLDDLADYLFELIMAIREETG